MKTIQTQANIGKRALATIIDYTIYLIFWSLYVYQLGAPNETGGYSVTGWPAFFLGHGFFIFHS